MPPRAVVAVWLAALFGAVVLAFPPTRGALASVGAHAGPVTSPAGAGGTSGSRLRVTGQAAPPPPALRVPAAGVHIPGGYDLVGWALIDRRSGQLLGSSGNGSSMTDYSESMIKAWIAADYLSQTVRAGKKPSQQDLALLARMIVTSDDQIAGRYYDLDGEDAVMSRLNRVCGIHATVAMSGWWSYTSMTPVDAARYGECLANGSAAGAYTPNLLGWMRQVTGGVNDQPHGPTAHTGGGRWGVIDALPAALAAQTSIKNGWEPEVDDHQWHVNCLAILPGQVLTVMVRYPWTSPNGNWQYATNLAPGAAACRNIAAQMLYQPAL